MPSFSKISPPLPFGKLRAGLAEAWPAWTLCMQQPQDELRRDLTVVRKHVWFIAAVFVGAIVVALTAGLAFGASGQATASVEVKVTAVEPVFGLTSIAPSLDSYQDLAESPQVVDRVRQKVEAGASEDLLARVEVKGSRPLATSVAALGSTRVGTVSVTAQGDSPQKAADLANAWAEALAAEAVNLRADPKLMAGLQEQVNLAQQKLEGESGLDSSSGGGQGLEEVRQELASKREARAELSTAAANVDQAVDFLRAAQKGSPPPSLAEVRLALAGFLGGGQDEGLLQATSLDELLGGLELRQQLQSGALTGLSQQVDSLASREQALESQAADREAALANYEDAVRSLRAAELAAQLTDVDAKIEDRAAASSQGLIWLARLAAGAALGLVVGVVGAFVLETVGPLRRRLRREGGPGG